MIQVKYKNRITDAETMGREFVGLHLKSFEYLTKKLLKENNIDIDVIIDLKDTGENPLGCICYRIDYNGYLNIVTSPLVKKFKTYKRKNTAPFIVLYLNRIYKSTNYKMGVIKSFKICLLHELYHFIMIKYYSKFREKRVHKNGLGATVDRNNLNFLRRELKILAINK